MEFTWIRSRELRTLEFTSIRSRELRTLEFTSIRSRELRTFDCGRSRLSRDDRFRSGAHKSGPASNPPTWSLVVHGTYF
jgi:hypothetical protein